MARTRCTQNVSLPPADAARVTAAREVLGDTTSRIHRRALDVYFATLPADQRAAIDQRAAAGLVRA